MKKIVRQQNYLRELINSQGNGLLTMSALKSVAKGILMPFVNNPEEGAVLYRVSDKTGISGTLQRLEFAGVSVVDFSDSGNNLMEKVWTNTGFICVMTHRYVSVLLWDTHNVQDDFAKYYYIVNSKLQNEVLDVIARNSLVDIKPFKEKFTPDRRDNLLMNSSIRSLIENLDELSKDAVLGFAEHQITSVKESDTRIVAHEIRNQLSICDLYTEVLKKYFEKNEIQDETLKNAVNAISKAVKIANGNLINLKSNSLSVKTLNLKNVVEQAKIMSSAYFENKDIKFVVENDLNVNIVADENNLLAVIINVIKNGIEAFDDYLSARKSGKYINLKMDMEGAYAVIRVINNASEIKEPLKIFEKGYTKKEIGSGLGLYICRNMMTEINGEIELVSTGEETEFAIKIPME